MADTRGYDPPATYRLQAGKLTCLDYVRKTAAIQVPIYSFDYARQFKFLRYQEIAVPVGAGATRDITVSCSDTIDNWLEPTITVAGFPAVEGGQINDGSLNGIVFPDLNQYAEGTYVFERNYRDFNRDTFTVVSAAPAPGAGYTVTLIRRGVFDTYRWNGPNGKVSMRADNYQIYSNYCTAARAEPLLREWLARDGPFVTDDTGTLSPNYPQAPRPDLYWIGQPNVWGVTSEIRYPTTYGEEFLPSVHNSGDYGMSQIYIGRAGNHRLRPLNGQSTCRNVNVPCYGVLVEAPDAPQSYRIEWDRSCPI
jgi:hypothetical protein